MTDEVDRSALARLWSLDADGAGWWRWTSRFAEARNSYNDPPSGPAQRGEWIRRGVTAQDDSFSGEMEAR